MRIIWFRVRAALRGRAGDAGMSTKFVTALVVSHSSVSLYTGVDASGEPGALRPRVSHSASRT